MHPLANHMPYDKPALDAGFLHVRRSPVQFSRAYADLSQGVADARAGDPIPYIGSTSGTKRDGMDLDPSKWLVENYHRSGGPLGGPWLWAHEVTRPPIGAARATVDSRKLTLNVRYDQEDPFAVGVESKVRRGFMGACSVSWDFCARDGSRVGFGRAQMMGGRVPSYLQASAFMDLTEASNVPVGMDPDALVQRSLRSLGLLYGAPFPGYLRDYDDPGSDVTAEELQEAVLAEFESRGIDLSAAVELWQDAIHTRGGTPIHATPKAPMDTEWDADAELAQVEGEAALRRMHALQDYDGDPDTKDSWSLPHHGADGHVVWHGLTAAMARLNQVDAPAEDKASAYAHLAAHYRQFGKTPPETRIADGLYTRGLDPTPPTEDPPPPTEPADLAPQAVSDLLAAISFPRRGAAA